jgi:hypothetical protein
MMKILTRVAPDTVQLPNSEAGEGTSGEAVKDPVV